MCVVCLFLLLFVCLFFLEDAGALLALDGTSSCPFAGHHRFRKNERKKERKNKNKTKTRKKLMSHLDGHGIITDPDGTFYGATVSLPSSQFRPDK